MIVEIAHSLADGQHGVLARHQLLAAGVSRSTIDRHLKRHFLFPTFPGVYAVGRRWLQREGIWMAAVLFAGGGAVIGFRSAGAAWGMCDFRPSVEIVRSRSLGSRRGIFNLEGRDQSIPLVTRRTRSLPAQDVMKIGPIPVTSPARTLFDLAASEPEHRLKREFLEADRNELLEDDALLECLDHARGRPGASAFRRQVEQRIPEVQRTKSVLEGLFLDLCRKHHIEIPESNVPLGKFEVDCLWRKEGLVVELQGAEFHQGGEMLERDTLKANELRMDGWNVVHFTWRDVTRRSDRVAVQVKQELKRGGLARVGGDSVTHPS